MTAPISADLKTGSRLEDQRFLTGRGRFTDDERRLGQVYVQIVRSDHAHAEIKGIDVGAATDVPGVLGVWTGTDLVADGLGPMPCSVVAATEGPITIPPPRPCSGPGPVCR